MDFNPEIKFFDVKLERKLEISDVFNKNRALINSNFLIIYLSDDGEKERQKLRGILNNYPFTFFLMSDDNKIAELAWKVNADYFININRKDWKKQFEIGIKNVYQKKSNKKKQVHFRTHSGVSVIDYNNINIIKADGNYSNIHIDNGKIITITKQLGQLEKVFNQYDHQIQRFGKSTIINLNNIKMIKNKTIIFTSGFKVQYPKYSKSFMELKKNLLWSN
jgi:hypothetical protein